MMSRFSNCVIAIASAVAAISPVVARAAPAEIERSAENVDGENLRGGYFVPLAIIVAIILGVVILSSGHKNNPVSS